MGRPVWALALMAAVAAALCRIGPSRRLVNLPPGTVEVHSEIVVEGGTEVAGRGTVLRAADDFTGRAVMVVRGAGARLHGFTIDGNRAALEVRAELPPSNVAFARYTRGNGILAEGVSDLTIEGVRFRNIAGFAILVSRGKNVSVERVEITDSGSRNAAGANNTTGGILFEEGTTGFRASGCSLRRVLGNGIWTHSLYTSPRNGTGLIALNSFETIGRDAIQVGHATDVRVVNNTGRNIGFPKEAYDAANRALPVAIDTAGNVEGSSYAHNRFETIAGKCIDLDGFHDGEVRGNVCRDVRNFAVVMNNSNPDMQSRGIRVEDNEIEGAWYGGIFVIGSGHRVVRNRLLHLNAKACAGCEDLLRTGIYLAAGAARSDIARGNVIEDNEMTGALMDRQCIGYGQGVSADANLVRNNRCRGN